MVEAFRKLDASGHPHRYDNIHMVLGEGDYVLSASERSVGGTPTAFYDPLRVRNGLIVEHWDVLQTIPPRADWKKRQRQNFRRWAYPSLAAAASRLPQILRPSWTNGIDMSDITRGLLIGGKEVPAQGNRLTDDVSPWTGALYAKVAAASPSDVTAAVDAAATAFPAWSAMLPYERRKIFLKAADLMEKRVEAASR